jgi:hypothetical protein
MPSEIRLRDERPIRVVTREDRERGQTRALPILEAAERSRIGAFAKRAFEASGVRDYARCDIIEEGGRLFALEVNGQPRMPDPWFEACASGAGLDSDQYVAAIILAALHRYSSAGIRRAEVPPGLRAMLPIWILDRMSS